MQEIRKLKKLKLNTKKIIIIIIFMHEYQV